MKEREKRKKKAEILEMKKQLEEKWAMIKWITQFIEENQEQWRKDREERQKEKHGEILGCQSPPLVVLFFLHNVFSLPN